MLWKLPVTSYILINLLIFAYSVTFLFVYALTLYIWQLPTYDYCSLHIFIRNYLFFFLNLLSIPLQFLSPRTLTNVFCTSTNAMQVDLFFQYTIFSQNSLSKYMLVNKFLVPEFLRNQLNLQKACFFFNSCNITASQILLYIIFDSVSVIAVIVRTRCGRVRQRCCAAVVTVASPGRALSSNSTVYCCACGRGRLCKLCPALQATNRRMQLCCSACFAARKITRVLVGVRAKSWVRANIYWSINDGNYVLRLAKLQVMRIDSDGSAECCGAVVYPSSGWPQNVGWVSPTVWDRIHRRWGATSSGRSPVRTDWQRNLYARLHINHGIYCCYYYYIFSFLPT